jgi:hypothetical protein
MVGAWGNENHPRSRDTIGFVPFMIFLFKQPFKLDYVWAMLCLLGVSILFFVIRANFSMRCLIVSVVGDA